MFRDLWYVAKILGERVSPGGILTIAQGTHFVHAATDDGIVHLAEVTIRSIDDLALYFPCRRLVIDGQANELTHLLQRDDVPVDCMTCLARERNR